MTNQNGTKKPEVFIYHPLDDLSAMSLADLDALWELVPTDRQREYKKIYDRTRRDEGASVSDALELRMVNQLLDKYRQRGQVPIGAYWVPTPPQIQKAASTNTEIVRSDDGEAAQVKKPSMVVLALGIACVLVFAFLMLRSLGSRSSKVPVTGTITYTPTITPTVLHTATPTPLALEAQDSIIRGGDTSGSALIYPVNLRVILGSEVQPRIFIVQRKLIQTTEWNYEDNPDTASYISGLIVRPVLGIPWSEENEVLFDRMAAGTAFVLQMNTGAALRFQFVSLSLVNRADTSAFRQTGPGLVLALIGHRNPETNEPTPNRVIVLANYLPEQELASGILSGIQLPVIDAPTPTLTPTPVQRMDVQLIAAESTDGRVAIRLRIYNGRYSRVRLDSQSVWLIYGYTERPVGPRVAAEIQPFDLEPGQAVDLTLTFAWHGEPFATLGVLGDYQFAIAWGREIH